MKVSIKINENTFEAEGEDEELMKYFFTFWVRSLSNLGGDDGLIEQLEQNTTKLENAVKENKKNGPNKT